MLPGVDKGGDFMRDEQVIMENAVVTAEAVISIAVQKSLYSIERSKVLVCGFGRCGRALAARFKALGADVMVMARRKSREAQGDRDMRQLALTRLPRHALIQGF